MTTATIKATTTMVTAIPIADRATTTVTKMTATTDTATRQVR